MFGQLENIVDIGAVFKHIVDKIGGKQLIDPITKKDPIQEIIEFFAQDQIKELSRLSTEGTTHISTPDVVKYLSNHIDTNQAFFNISKIML